MLTADLYTPAKLIMIDLDENRLRTAKELGATHVFKSDDDVVKNVMELTGGVGVDTVIEAVGIPATFRLCQDIVAPGGTIANLGVHGKAVPLHLEDLWDKSISAYLSSRSLTHCNPDLEYLQQSPPVSLTQLPHLHCSN